MDQQHLFSQLSKCFDIGELNILCWTLNVDPEAIKGDDKATRIWEIIHFFTRRGRVPDLIRYCKKERPEAFSEYSADEQPRPGVRHNLPQPDYGKFIGRELEVNALSKELRVYPYGQWPVVVVHGIGGSGKTTLVLNVAWQLVLNYEALSPDARFDAIVWISAKEKVLTPSGIRSRSHHFQSISDLRATVEQTLGFIASTSHDAGAYPDDETVLGEMLSRQRTLLIIDNLETVDDERIEAFLREPPYPSKVVVTSRHKLEALPGLSIRLAGMPEKDSLLLIERECQLEADNIVVLNPEDSRRLAERTGGMPLAIVWSVGLLRSNYDIGAVLQRLGEADTDIVHFCFDFSMRFVKPDQAAYRLLVALSLFESEVGRRTLGIVTDLLDDRVTFYEGLNRLERLSLVTRQSDHYSLLPLTRSYMQAELAGDEELRNSIVRRWHVTEESANGLEVLWQTILSARATEAPEQFADVCSELVRRLCDLLGTALDSGPHPQYERKLVYWLNWPPVFFGLRVPSALPIIFLTGSDIVTAALDSEFRSFARRQQLVLVIPLLEQLSPSEIRRAQDSMRHDGVDGVIVLTHDDLSRLAIAREPGNQFAECVFRQVRRAGLSPYVEFGATPTDMFYGRERELDDLEAAVLKPGFCTVAGSRRMGKTSLALSLHRRLSQRGDITSVYMDCATMHITVSLRAVLSDIQRRIEEATGIATSGEILSRFTDLIRNTRTEQHLLLIMDEVDLLLTIDRNEGWRLCSEMREAVRAGDVGIIMVGERSLHTAMRDVYSPLFLNGIQGQWLEPLDKPSVNSLVRSSMNRLGIRLVDDSAAVDEIWETTGGHPSLVQALCRQLVDYCDSIGQYYITRQTVKLTVERPEFLDRYLVTWWGSAQALEKLLTLLIAEAQASCTASLLREVIYRHGIMLRQDDIDLALQYLVDVSRILSRAGPRGDFTFVSPTFPRMLSRVYDLKRLQDQLMREVRDDWTSRRPIFHVGGPLPANSAYYIERNADRDFLSSIRRMDYVVIAEPKGSGKTSLINRLVQNLPPSRMIALYIDMTALDVRSEEAWYHSLSASIIAQLDQMPERRLSGLPPIQNAAACYSFLNDLSKLAKRAQTDIVIILDEVGSNIVPWAGHFFSVLRAVFNTRALGGKQPRLTFVLAGEFLDTDLIDDRYGSPFNVANRVHLDDFSVGQVQLLVNMLETDEPTAHLVAERIHYWTDGQPYLTQLLCRRLSSIPNPNPESVDVAAESAMFEDRILRGNVLTRLEQKPDLLPLLLRIRNSVPMKAFFSVEYDMSRLYMLGLVKADHSGYLVIRNRIYERMLDSLLQATGTERERIVAILDSKLQDEQLEGLSFAFGIVYRNLEGQDKRSRIWALVNLLEQRGRLSDLLAAIGSSNRP